MDKNTLETLLATAAHSHASSLHLIPGNAPSMRVDGSLQVAGGPVTARQLEELTHEFLFADHREQLKSSGQVDVLYSTRAGIRFRTTIMRQSEGLSILLRRVPTEVPKLADLGLPPLVGSFTQFHRGLVLVTGANGCGKSTTLAGMVDKLNHDTLCHVVTVESPIDFIHPQGLALLHQREVGVHVASAAQGVREALRVGANVVVVGQLTDFEGLDIAVSAAEEGCLVLAAFPASNVAAALSELTALCPSEERARMRARLAETTRVVMSQVLLQRKGGNGRVPVVEILLNNAAVRRAIRKGQYGTLGTIMARCRGLGMQTMDVALRNLVKKHVVTLEEALYYATDRDQVRPTLGARG